MAETRGSKRKALAEETVENEEARPEPIPDKVQKVAVARLKAHIASTKNFIDWLKDEWMCPITYELPIDPVEAEDGKCYERAAIEKYFATQPDGPTCLSPVTRTTIGKRLVPNEWRAEAIHKMMTARAVVDEKSGKAWVEARQRLMQMQALQAKANAGDARAMGSLGFSYRDGTRGFEVDKAAAFEWFKKAAILRDPPAATACAIAYIKGDGVARNLSRAISMLTFAATLGSEHACAILGQSNQRGHHGFEQNFEEATYWYKEMGKCKIRDSVDAYRDRASEWLRHES
ncbi:MAG: hypothetical protein CMI29_08320 [Opitutae bacterium]|nr:hypothetical protein [Opitutae bacterium]